MAKFVPNPVDLQRYTLFEARNSSVENNMALLNFAFVIIPAALLLSRKGQLLHDELEIPIRPPSTPFKNSKALKSDE